MEEYLPQLEWIDTQKQVMLETVTRWSGINTHTFHLSGLKLLSEDIKKAFSVFQERVEEVALPPVESVDINGRMEQNALAPALKITKHPLAEKQGLFVIHMDTVYLPEEDFQEAVLLDDKTLRGPGVTDAKGGIVVLLKALEALERSRYAGRIGWNVVINTDEEIGSPGSTGLIRELALKSHIGFVFEPCFPDGNLVGSRKGSGNFSLVAQGRAAHAGRDYHEGKNAVSALAKLITSMEKLNDTRQGLTVNFGVFHGGTGLNVVPSHAITRFNARVLKHEDQLYFQNQLKKAVSRISEEEGVKLTLHGGFSAPPKPLDEKTLPLFQQFRSCGLELGLKLDLKESGGVCDGNRLSAAGLPTVDSLGVLGGDIHSPKEYLHINSLIERTKLTSLFLLKWAKGEWEV